MDPIDVRQPTGFANFRGDQRQILGEGAKGPSYTGEYLWPVTAEYDPETDRTRVGFSLIPPAEVQL